MMVANEKFSLVLPDNVPSKAVAEFLRKMSELIEYGACLYAYGIDLYLTRITETLDSVREIQQELSPYPEPGDDDIYLVSEIDEPLLVSPAVILWYFGEFLKEMEKIEEPRWFDSYIRRGPEEMPRPRLAKALMNIGTVESLLMRLRDACERN